MLLVQQRVWGGHPSAAQYGAKVRPSRHSGCRSEDETPEQCGHRNKAEAEGVAGRETAPAAEIFQAPFLLVLEIRNKNPCTPYS